MALVVVVVVVVEGEVGGEHFDVVVVGSGFGGSISAYRLAQAGRSVCVLERGRAYAPHSFPRSPAGLAQNLWGPSAGLHGMFDVWFNTSDSEPLTLVGFKGVGNDPGIDSWRDTTCLFTRILEGRVEADEYDEGPERARGLIVIEPAMFARQLTTFRGHPVAVVRFGWMFARSLARVYWSRPRSRRPA